MPIAVATALEARARPALCHMAPGQMLSPGKEREELGLSYYQRGCALPPGRPLGPRGGETSGVWPLAMGEDDFPPGLLGKTSLHWLSEKEGKDPWVSF